MHLLDRELGHGLLSYIRIVSTMTSHSMRPPPARGWLDLARGPPTHQLRWTLAASPPSIFFVIQCQPQKTRSVGCRAWLAGGLELTMSALLIWASSCFSRVPGEVALVSTMVGVCLVRFVGGWIFLGTEEAFISVTKTAIKRGRRQRKWAWMRLTSSKSRSWAGYSM